MAAQVLVNAASSDGTYGQGGADGDYFVWNNIASPVRASGQVAPLTFYIYISGTATVTMKGAYEDDGTLVPVSGAEWSSSTIDAVYASVDYFAFDIDITSGTVTVAVMS